MNESQERTKSRMKKVILVALSLILPLLAIGCFALTSTSPFNSLVETSPKVTVKELTVYYIGNNPSLTKIVDQMQTLKVQTKQLKLQRFNPNDTSKDMNLNERSLVLIDSDWISQRIGDSEIHMFLRKTIHKGAILASTGKLTSKFFEILDEAGVDRLGRDEMGKVRNPAYDNPPLVGFKLKQSTTPTGYRYFYPSIFTCNSEDTDTQVQSLANWIGG